MAPIGISVQDSILGEFPRAPPKSTPDSDSVHNQNINETSPTISISTSRLKHREITALSYTAPSTEPLPTPSYTPLLPQPTTITDNALQHLIQEPCNDSPDRPNDTTFIGPVSLFTILYFLLCLLVLVGGIWHSKYLRNRRFKKLSERIPWTGLGEVRAEQATILEECKSGGLSLEQSLQLLDLVGEKMVGDVVRRILNR